MKINMINTFISCLHERLIPQLHVHFQTCFEVIKIILTFGLLTILLASCIRPSYAHFIQQKAVGLVLADYIDNTSAQSASCGFFVRNISMHLHIMVELERDTFECAGFLCYLSANPFQLCHPHLVVNGEAPIIKRKGCISHA